MSDQFWLSKEQLARIKPYFPLSHGVPRVDDLKVISGIIHVIRNSLRWWDAPTAYGPHTTLCNGLSGGRRWTCLTRFLRLWLLRTAHQTA